MKGGEEGLLPATGTRTFQRRRVSAKEEAVVCWTVVVLPRSSEAKLGSEAQKKYFSREKPLVRPSSPRTPRHCTTSTYFVPTMYGRVPYLAADHGASHAGIPKPIDNDSSLRFIDTVFTIMISLSLHCFFSTHTLRTPLMMLAPFACLSIFQSQRVPFLEPRRNNDWVPCGRERSNGPR